MAEKKALFQRLFSKYIYNPEKRGLHNGIFPYYDLFSPNESGEIVSVERGSRTSIGFSCCNVLSQDIAKLPVSVKQDTQNGKIIVKKSPIHRLIHNRPNNYTSSFNFMYELVFNMLTFGNAYYLIMRDEIRNVSQLIPLPVRDVTPILVNDGNPEILYEYKDRFIAQSDILHFKMYSFDGILGVSPIVWNATAFGYRLKQDKYKTKVLGTKPPGILSFSEQLDDTQYKQNQDQWNAMSQGDNLGGTPVLSGGASYQPMMIPPNEGQMIEASEMNDEEISGIYRVPPSIIQRYKRATFSNAEQQDLIYLKYSITPILKVIEQEYDSKLFKESNKKAENPLFTKFNIKAMLRGDIKTQAEWYKMLRSFGLASANEIREMEDLPKLDGKIGDMILVQGAMIPLDQLREFYSSKTPTTPLETKGIGFDLQAMKDNIERIEILNNHGE